MSVPLGSLRALSNAFLWDVCSISRYVETNTADGVTEAWSDIAMNVRCSVAPIGTGGGEQLEAGAQIAAVNRWTVSLPALTDVTVRDRLVTSGRTFEVERVDARTFEVRRDCICREIV